MKKASFGGSGGGRGRGGETMLRTVHRAIRASAGSHEQPYSNSSTTTTSPTTKSTRPTIKNIFSLSSSSSIDSLNLISSTGLPFDFDWESIGAECDDDDDDDYYKDDEFERENGFCDESVPSADEVQHAVSSLKQVLETSSFLRPHYYLDKDVGDQIHTPTGLTHRVCSSDSELDWIEPPLHLCNSKILESRRSDQVYDAFHMLRTDHSVQRMVISLSSDKAVWDAVMNNEVVRELRQSLNEEAKERTEAKEKTEAKNNVPMSSNEASDSDNAATNILSWIFINTKAKMMKIIEKITCLVNELFKHTVSDNTTGTESDQFEKRVRAAFMVSVVVLLMVVLGRARRA